jgi:hydrogenase maturation protease
VENKNILVLGVGNILMSDEGAGVYVVRSLEQNFQFSKNISFLDGGTLGMRLLNPISKASHLIVADTAMLGYEPGTISRLTINDIRTGNVVKNSMHQLSFAETLSMAEIMELLPPTVIIAIEPFDIETMGTKMTPLVAANFDSLCFRVLDEIKASGGTFLQKDKAFSNMFIDCD